MTALLADREATPIERGVRALLLIWQNPSTRRFVKAGTLTVSEGDFRFRYEEEATNDPEFFPLDEFPSVDQSYRSEFLPAFFANRIMPSERDSYDSYLGWLGLESGSPDLPVEILARTGGGRATDTFHIVEKPLRSARVFVGRFFVSGVRHHPGSATALAELRGGDTLALASDQANAVNSRAYRVVNLAGERIGWIPDWLCGEIAELAEDGWRLQITAETVSPEAPSHVQLLCRVTAERSI